jgi:hypothetical protein
MLEGVSGKSAPLLCANWAYSNEVRFALPSRPSCAGHGIRFPNAKAFDLLLDLFPRGRRPLESKRVAALKMIPQFAVAQEPPVNAFHARSVTQPTKEDFGMG